MTTTDTLACAFTDCSKALYYKSVDLCQGHFAQQKRGAELTPLRARRTKYQGACAFDPCERDAAIQALCPTHYEQKRRGRDLTPLKPHTRRATGASINNSKTRQEGVDPNDPLTWPMSVTKDGYVLRHGSVETVREHRAVMAAHLGRPLLAHENVHHINGVRDDNRIENLELWSTSQPAGQRVADKLAWAREIIALYGDEVAA